MRHFEILCCFRFHRMLDTASLFAAELLLGDQAAKR